MKKNVMTRIASGLMVAVLLTTCVISGTFAKYVTTGSVNDTARVAKWGIAIDAKGSLYSTDYLDATDNTPAPHSTTDHDTAISVCADGSTDKLVAPGTQSSLEGMSFKITGKPEVRTELKLTVSAQDIYLAAGKYGHMVAVVDAPTFVADTYYTEEDGIYTLVASGDGFPADGTTYYTFVADVLDLAAAYYPVVYANTNTDAQPDANKTITSIATKLAKNNKADAADTDASTAGVSYVSTATYAPNTNIATVSKLGTNTITWSWAYGDKDTNTGNDVQDTFLGNLIAGSVDSDLVFVGTVESTPVAAKVSAADANGLLKANDAEIGSLKTSFNITIEATQID